MKISLLQLEKKSDTARVEIFGQSFVRNAVNAAIFCKKCGDCGECGENKYFTAFLTKILREIHRVSYKNSPHMISNVYSISFKFTRNCNAVPDSWGSEQSSCRHAGGERFEPV